MKNSMKEILKRMVAVMLLLGILVTIPNVGDEPGIMPCGEPEEEYPYWD